MMQTAEPAKKLKVEAKPLYEQVANQIEGMILREEYKKGDLLPSESELIALTGVSRITVREALRTLAEVGMIQTFRGKGSVVALDRSDLIRKSDVQERYNRHRENFCKSTDIRIIVEPELARLAAIHSTAEEIGQLEYFLQLEQKEGTADSKLDQFHRHIVSIANNDILLSFFDGLTAIEATDEQIVLVPPFRQKTFSVQFNEFHVKIFRAIKERDGEFAYFYMKEHLLSLKETYEHYFDRYYR